MSNITRRKHILKEMSEDDFELPKEPQQIVRVICSRGNNLHEVEEPSNLEHFLVSMPTKFRKNVWVKRGDFILVEPIEEGDKVKAEICKILTSEHVKEYTKAGIWPERFSKRHLQEPQSDGDDSDDLLAPNPNRPVAVDVDDSDEEDSSESDE